MANFGKLLITNVGLNEQYKAQSGKTLKFKRIALGSGAYSGNILALKNLIAEKVSVDISKGYIKNSSYTVEGFFSNEGLNTGFEWREIGVFVEDENGNDVLYCYANAGNAYDYIPATADEHYSKYIRVAMAIGNATDISIVETDGLIYVDIKTFDAAILDLQTDIDQLWPSKVLTGSALVAEDCANLPFVGMSIYGKSTQNQTTGAQLIKQPYSNGAITASGITFTPNSDGSVLIKGTATANAYFTMDGGYSGSQVSIPEWLIEGETYTISGGNADLAVCMFLYKSTGETISFNSNSSPNTFSMPSGYDYYGLFIQVAVGRTVNTTVYPMLNKGAFAIEYEPYTGGAPSPSPEYPQEIASVENPSVDVYGKNLLKPKNNSNGGYTAVVNADGSVTVTGSASTTSTIYLTIATPSAENPLRLVKGQKYCMSADSTNGKYIGTRTMNDDGHSIYSTANAWNNNWKEGYLNIAQIYLESSGHAIGDTSLRGTYRFQLEVGENATEFEGYREKQTVSLQPILRGIPVSEGGNYTDENGQRWICDEIDLERGVYIQRIKKVILDGTESWQKNDEDDNNKYLYFVRVNDVGSDSSYCDKLTRKSTNTLNKSGISADYAGIYVSKSYQVIYLNINTLIEENTVDGLKSVLSENNLSVYYPYAEPIETALTDSEIAAYQELHSNNPSTTIFNNAGAGMNVQYITKAHEAVFKKVYSSILDSDIARCASGSYVGDGTYGSDNPMILNFDFTPKLLIINARNSNTTYGGAFGILYDITHFYASGQDSSGGWNFTMSHSSSLVRFADNQVRWYHSNSSNAQHNAQGIEYRYTAFG